MTATATPMPTLGKIGQLLFPTSVPFAFQTQRFVAECAFGGGEVTEVARAAERMTEGDFESWYAGWKWIADIAREDADRALADGHRVTARNRFFNAANYYRSAGFFVPPTDDRELPIWRSMVDAFVEAGKLCDPSFEWITWPYEGGTLPAYVVKPSGAEGRLPTVVYVNGSDGTKEESWFLGGRAFVDRGLMFVGIEGPGQGEPLRLGKQYTRPDYEAAVSPLLDTLVRRPDVDADRIALVGVSMGGYYATRVAAYEPRFRCLALHGACFNIHDDLYENFPPIRPRLQWVTGTFDDAAARERLQAFDLGGHAGKVRCPVYLAHGADDLLVNPAAAEKTWAELTVDDKTKRIWTADGLGGSPHCSIDNPMQAFPELADWVVDRLRD
jgi:dienelactone hydrolase